MVGAPIPLDRAYLTAIWLETLFYGINLVLFTAHLYLTLSSRSRRAPRLARGILLIALLMFLFSTIHVSLGFARLLQGFTSLSPSYPSASSFFSDVSIPANVAKVVIHTVNSILGDSIVVWRCYHVWGGSWKVCLAPGMLILASAVCGFGQGVIFAGARETHSAFGAELARWNGSLFTLSLVTNVVVTSLIAARIMYISRKLGSAFKYRRVLTVVVESGAIYSSALIIEIILYFVGTNAFYIVYDPIAQLTAIVPTMIIILSSLGLTSTDLDDRERDSNTARMTVEDRLSFARPPQGTFSYSDGTNTTELMEVRSDKSKG